MKPNQITRGKIRAYYCHMPRLGHVLAPVLALAPRSGSDTADESVEPPALTATSESAPTTEASTTTTIIATTAPMAIEYRIADRRVPVGGSTPVKFKLTDPVTRKPRDDIRDMTVLYYGADGRGRRVVPARALGVGHVLPHPTRKILRRHLQVVVDGQLLRRWVQPGVRDQRPQIDVKRLIPMRFDEPNRLIHEQAGGLRAKVRVLPLLPCQVRVYSRLPCRVH